MRRNRRKRLIGPLSRAEYAATLAAFVLSGDEPNNAEPDEQPNRTSETKPRPTPERTKEAADEKF